MRSVPTFGLALAALALASPALAQPPPAGEDLKISVVTFGPGDHPFFKFGHNAILVETASGDGLLFNWGTFTFDDPALIPKFLLGRFQYWLSVSGRDENFFQYRESNRTIELQELNLTPAERQRLYLRLRENALPQHRAYLYDYFWDNCSTRVRDMVDFATEGRLRRAAGGPAAMTFRAHALRLVADLAWEYVSLHLGLGSHTDGPMTRWEEAFLPERLRDLMNDVRLGGDGADRPLVKSSRVVFQAARPPPLAAPPSWSASFALVGLALGGALLGLALTGRRPLARVGFALVAGFAGLVSGLLGVILLFLWGFTNHRAAWANTNLLLVSPLGLAFTGFALGLARARADSLRRAARVAGTILTLAVLGLLLRVTGLAVQDNGSFLALFVPLWTGLFLGLRRLRAALPERSTT
jgi:hypothetical protein